MSFNHEDWLLLAADYAEPAFRALTISLAAWLVAFAARVVVHKLVDRILRNRRNSESTPTGNGVISMSKALSNTVFYLVLLLSLPSIFEALPIKALEPANTMIDEVLAFLPKLLGALVVFVIFFLLARIVANLLANLLTTLGIDRVPTMLGLTMQAATPRISTLTGRIVLTVLTTLGVTQSFRILEADEITKLVDGLTAALMPLLLAWVTFAIGLFLGQLAHRALAPIGTSTRLAWLTRAAVIVSTSALALRATNLDKNLVIFAYGAAMTSAALAFGLGGRDAAAQLIARWRTESNPQPTGKG